MKASNVLLLWLAIFKTPLLLHDIPNDCTILSGQFVIIWKTFDTRTQLHVSCSHHLPFFNSSTWNSKFQQCLMWCIFQILLKVSFQGLFFTTSCDISYLDWFDFTEIWKIYCVIELRMIEFDFVVKARSTYITASSWRT